MTPERKAWWDNLPKEEIKVRQNIAVNKLGIKFNGKMVLQNLRRDSVITPSERKSIKTARCNALTRIRCHKHNIKLLRKHIGMKPLGRIRYFTSGATTVAWYCPNCKLMFEHRDNYCCCCGQKLRWK